MRRFLLLCQFIAPLLSTALYLGTASTISLEAKKLSAGAETGKPLAMSSNDSTNEESGDDQKSAGKIEKLKQREATLARLLAEVRLEKLATLRSRPLTIGVVGFGRFGQFIARTFSKHGRVVVTSRSDYTDIANGMGVKYVPLSDPSAFLSEGLDVVVFAVSILSFEKTIQDFAPHFHKYVSHLNGQPGPLVVDVLSVKEHPRQVLLELLPKECDILCTHPMFGPDSGKNGWQGLTFVYERTRIDGVILDPAYERSFHQLTQEESGTADEMAGSFVELGSGKIHTVHENSEAHVEGMDRMERFLSIWEEEGCRMVALSCANHDAYAANSQFITHLMGRILGSQGLHSTPIDTKGFESVLKLMGNTMADSFDLFYGLYKYNQNSAETIRKLKVALDDVVDNLQKMEQNDNSSPLWGKNGTQNTNEKETGKNHQENLVSHL
uniref:Prephenate/arogenate dehydrogenase domain-containing protein n=1 Tax=Trieres chinensis TaxID=1514140 RepID=A0A7S1ZVD2_TRICV|mmetsp:Transcript_33421/g.68229  ORF Transcript_33421/g.68229 Transcript_33421/m.68229 type:complete len:439 (+) Transcript_33421:93-1409(+)|eukprot:CAMPEP_0183327514 /NCGR_PEP_ID=MMETSP0160_2-20130417/83804_1 /TAXON_ID=2839 ORGANISM="Odontella Sinensis, Strain Grunow 1884" /NCGR_SAMPLE_ID=MMETSP0160_2 /ASSEMBLY_ACC=CAM_ASM_000250 /LENGTH=438 /DNA_ID=CAMNT_0025495647 /DNA_START=93 /DNA_END=1412 /DNA_ORIENTATION=+